MGEAARGSRGPNSGRHNRVPSDEAGSLCLRFTSEAGTAQTRFRRSGFWRDIGMEVGHAERQADGGSKKRCTRGHPGYRLGCRPRVLGAGEMRPVSEGRTDELARAESIAEAGLRAYTENRVTLAD